MPEITASVFIQPEKKHADHPCTEQPPACEPPEAGRARAIYVVAACARPSPRPTNHASTHPADGCPCSSLANPPQDNRPRVLAGPMLPPPALLKRTWPRRQLNVTSCTLPPFTRVGRRLCTFRVFGSGCLGARGRGRFWHFALYGGGGGGFPARRDSERARVWQGARSRRRRHGCWLAGSLSA